MKVENYYINSDLGNTPHGDGELVSELLGGVVVPRHSDPIVLESTDNLVLAQELSALYAQGFEPIGGTSVTTVHRVPRGRPEGSPPEELVLYVQQVAKISYCELEVIGKGEGAGEDLNGLSLKSLLFMDNGVRG